MSFKPQSHLDLGQSPTGRSEPNDRPAHRSAETLLRRAKVENGPFGRLGTLGLGLQRETIKAKSLRKFCAVGTSRGMLRAQEAFAAINQLAEGSSPVRLVATEEPETTLHPAAPGVLMYVLREAASQTRVLVATCSPDPDLLDQIDPEEGCPSAAQASRDEARTGPVDADNRLAAQNHLCTDGDPLRLDRLESDRMARQRQVQLRMPEGAGDVG